MTWLRLTAAPQCYDESGGIGLSQVRRFNEAVDEAMTESMNRFAVQTDLFRDQSIGILSHDGRTPLAAIIRARRFSPRPRTSRRGGRWWCLAL